MFPLIAAVELLAKDFVLAADGRCVFPSKLTQKKKSFTLLLRFAMSYIQIQFSLLLFSFFECPILSRKHSYLDSFLHLLSSPAGTLYWMKENLHESKRLWRIQTQPAGHVCLVFARATVVVSKSSRSVPRLLGWVWGLETHRSVHLRSESLHLGPSTMTES